MIASANTRTGGVGQTAAPADAGLQGYATLCYEQNSKPADVLPRVTPP